MLIHRVPAARAAMMCASLRTNTTQPVDTRAQDHHLRSVVQATRPAPPLFQGIEVHLDILDLALGRAGLGRLIQAPAHILRPV